MASHFDFIQNDTFNDWIRSTHLWINPDDPKHRYLRRELIDKVFPVLRLEDKELLLDGLTKVINMIHLKFGFAENPLKNENLLWEQLTQNKLLDLRALLGIMLPFINDNENDEKKHALKRLSDLYIEKDNKGLYVYTNTQYNRCIRHNVNGNIHVIYRPFIKEYFLQHLELLLMSIETSANKLYINWVDVLPIKMNSYSKTKLYENTMSKIVGEITKDENGKIIVAREKPIQTIRLINNYIDPNPGISYQDFYNVMSNHLFHEIKNHKWLIYDIIIQGEAVSYIDYLEKKISLESLWDELLWSQLDSDSRNLFTLQWNNFLNSNDRYDNTVLHHFYFFFGKYHKNSQMLINRGLLILTKDPSEQEEDNEENVRITPETMRNAKLGLSKVPIEEIYLFFNHQLSAFKKSWFYYFIKIKGEKYLDTRSLDIPNATSVKIYVTPKNVYNYCKSLTHYVHLDLVTGQNNYVQIPHHWISLKPNLIKIILIRMLDIENLKPNFNDPLRNDWSGPNWFNINVYLSMLYPTIPKDFLPRANQTIHSIIRTKIVDIVFESLIYHGLLSDFYPNKMITNNALIETSINSKDDRKKANFKREQMKIHYFTGKNREEYEKEAYYYITGTKYGDLSPLRSKDYLLSNYQKKYFDFLTSDQIWTFTYAMNWVSQINFYHHYTNNRIIYITGATGVGKSTQVPKLLMYSQKMLDYNANGKIICTQPRVPPTVENAETISRELGVPIRAYDKRYDKTIFTSNYYVQYKYQKEDHLSQIDSFLRIVTDGTLYEEIKASPFLTKSNSDKYAIDAKGNSVEWVKTFTAGNKYDIVIVDEAHEHNANMDMILTLARDAAYVNNSLKLVIVSATMEDDEPIYRRYYRLINDNRAYPLSAFIENQLLDRANMDRRIHISPPGATTQYVIEDHYLSKEESDLINEKNFVDYGIKKTIEVANSTNEKDLLLFMSGQADIHRAVKEINEKTPPHIIAMGYYSELSEETKNMIVKIHQTLPYYTRFKEDVFLEEKDVTRRVPKGTYTRAIIIATNVAEASITLQNLKYVIDTGYAKTVIYDALEGIPKTLTLPISRSSSTQRKGRVGRVASGVVYYMYDQDKIFYNKTAYKIADSNARDHIVPLLKSDPRDSYIITDINDINQIKNLLEFKYMMMDKNYDLELILEDVLKNPRPYLDIIKKQYMYIPITNDITQYYTYYGKTNYVNYDLASLQSNLSKYLIENHDDYHYQQNVIFLSKGYTGYSNEILQDDDLSFYIIHPDENVITRNLYTGKMEAIKCNPSVTEGYYYYLLSVNDIQFTKEDIKTCRFHINDFNNFTLLKYPLAMNEARLQLMVTDIPFYMTDIEIRYSNIKNTIIAENIKDFYQEIIGYTDPNAIVTIKSLFLTKLAEIQRVTSLSILMDINNLLWYCYSIPYQLENDVLAVMILLASVPDISQWISETKSKNDIQKFFNTHWNYQGDMYFVWKIWNEIKDMIIKNNFYEYTNIDASLESHFYAYKDQYVRDLVIPYEEFLVIENMYQSGQLNTLNEFYYYVSQKVIDFKKMIQQKGIDSYLQIISKNNRISVEKLQMFLVEYLDAVFTQNKKIWMYQYEIDHQMTEEMITENVIEWAAKKLTTNVIINDHNYQANAWDHFLETYIRAFSINLIKNDTFRYLQFNKGVVLDPDYWSKRIPIEKTFLGNKTEYMIYHSVQTSSDKVSGAYLTPVKLEWILKLNPIYYFYLFFHKESIIYSMYPDENVIQSIKIIKDNLHLFDFNELISQLDKINNPILSSIIRNLIYQHFQKKLKI